ncbi:hypothetical protein DBR42_22430 [Pelomonas sp. HMWF004]|nr:hypothetical protein DBR42_22430 [Pelomonas sp. HMWF004]
MMKIFTSLLLATLSGTAFAYTEATATLQLSMVVHNLDGTNAPLIIANNNSGPLSSSRALVQEILYQGDLSVEQRLVRNSVDMHAMCVAGLHVAGSNTSIGACTPLGLAGTWSATGYSSEKSILLASADAGFSLTLLPGQTLTALAQLYTAAFNIGSSTDRGQAQFSIAGTSIETGRDLMAFSSNANDSVSFESRSYSFASTVFNDGTVDQIVNVRVTAWVSESNANLIGNTTPVPEPSTWLLLAAGVPLMGRRLAKLRTT